MRETSYRIGNGWDVHAFAANRKLILGGVEIPFERGLAGHSDADALLHAIADSILGALCWGDIGVWFPDTEERWKDADSSELLREVWSKAAAEGYRIVNCDCMVLLERPKLRPHLLPMRENVARLLECAPEQVSIKATTTEKLGFVGREEGIAVSATTLLMRDMSLS